MDPECGSGTQQAEKRAALKIRYIETRAMIQTLEGLRKPEQSHTARLQRDSFSLRVMQDTSDVKYLQAPGLGGHTHTQKKYMHIKSVSSCKKALHPWESVLLKSYFKINKDMFV